jgi:predicted dehydrogenase
VGDVSAATLHFDSGALGTIASTCLLKWRDQVGLQLISEGSIIELSEYDMVINLGQGRPVVPVRVNAFVREDRDFVDAVRGKSNRIRAPYAEALKTHRLASAVARAARAGRALELRPEPADA